LRHAQRGGEHGAAGPMGIPDSGYLASHGRGAAHPPPGGHPV